jgi:outer membrane receptor protein involved in Fe transport
MEESRAFGLEATYQPAPRFRLAAGLFRTDFDDLVIKMVTQSFQFQPTYQHANVPEARLDSLTLETRWDAADWVALRAAASWTEAENRTEGDVIPAIVDESNQPFTVDFVTPDIPYLPDRAGSLAVSFRPPRAGLTIELSTQYTGPILIQRYGATPDDVTFRRTPSFWIYNARATKRIVKMLDLFLGVDNIGDYLEEDLADREKDYTWGPLRGRYVYGGMTWRFDDRGSP